MRVSQKEYTDACRDAHRLLRDLGHTVSMISEGSSEIAYAERDKWNAINQLRRYARKLLKYGHHLLDCEWNNVTIGSMKDEKTSCTCGWIEFKADLRRLVR